MTPLELFEAAAAARADYDAKLKAWGDAQRAVREAAAAMDAAETGVKQAETAIVAASRRYKTKTTERN